MNFKDFTARIIRSAELMKEAQGLTIPHLIESAALEFVDDNFRAQGWEGKRWEDIKRDGTILVDTGALRRSFQSSVSRDSVRIYSELKYAWIHNEGVDMLVSIPEHTRGQYKDLGRGKKKKTGAIGVSAHKRQMKVPRRQFAPTEDSPSSTLNKRVEVIIATKTLQILKSP